MQRKETREEDIAKAKELIFLLSILFFSFSDMLSIKLIPAWTVEKRRREYNVEEDEQTGASSSVLLVLLLLLTYITLHVLFGSSFFFNSSLFTYFFYYLIFFFKEKYSYNCFAFIFSRLLIQPPTTLQVNYIYNSPVFDIGDDDNHDDVRYKSFVSPFTFL